MKTFKDYLQEAAYNTPSVEDNKDYHVKHVKKHQKLSSEFFKKYKNASNDREKDYFKRAFNAHDKAADKHNEALKTISRYGDDGHVYDTARIGAKHHTKKADSLKESFVNKDLRSNWAKEAGKHSSSARAHQKEHDRLEKTLNEPLHPNIIDHHKDQMKRHVKAVDAHKKAADAYREAHAAVQQKGALNASAEVGKARKAAGAAAHHTMTVNKKMYQRAGENPIDPVFGKTKMSSKVKRQGWGRYKL